MHVRKDRKGIRVVETEWQDRVALLVGHFACGPLIGVRQQLEPDAKPDRIAATAILGGLVAAFILSPPVIRLALLWTVLSPVALYIFSDIPETVYENRAYLSVLGIAVLGAWCAERVPILTSLLVVLFAARTIQRNYHRATPLRYWTLAYQESPNHWRVRYNYAQQLQQHGRDLDALPIFCALLDAPRPCGEEAAQYASMIYLKYGRLAEMEYLLGDRGQAILKFPSNARLRTLRASMLQAQGREEQAAVALQVARALA